MIRWILTGILRDKTRSVFPFSVVTVGVTLVVFFLGFIDGNFADMLDMTANLDTGHLRFVNKPFYEEEFLNPMDRALAGQKQTGAWLKENSDPRIQWSPRIRWGAIMDIPDEKGETRSQTPVTGMALDLLSPESPEKERLDLQNVLLEGRLPKNPREMLVGYELARDLEVRPGDQATLLGQSFDGGLAADNYTVVGTIKFGVFAMDKKMALIDLADAQESFYMEDMVTDWLGYLPGSVRYKDYARLKQDIEARMPPLLADPPKDWANDDEPIVLSVLDQRNLQSLANVFEVIKKILVGIFILLMALVLWNAGVLNVIHRYGELGLWLAMGQTHWKLVAMLGLEALMIGILGSIAGCILGGGIVYYLQEVGIDMGDAFAQTGLMLSDVARGRMSVEAFVLGVIPGLSASVLGSFFATIGLFKRSEAGLFRELEAG